MFVWFIADVLNFPQALKDKSKIFSSIVHLTHGLTHTQILFLSLSLSVSLSVSRRPSIALFSVYLHLSLSLCSVPLKGVWDCLKSVSPHNIPAFTPMFHIARHWICCCQSPSLSLPPPPPPTPPPAVSHGTSHVTTKHHFTGHSKTCYEKLVTRLGSQATRAQWVGSRVENSTT